MSVVHALWARNLRIFWRNKPSLIFNLVFPFFFVFIFSAVFSDFVGEGGNAIIFLLSGIIATTMFDSSFRVSSSTIEDITGGFMKEILVSPSPRIFIALGQFVSSATIAAVQGIVILLISFAIGFEVTSFMTIIYAILGMMFIGLVFAGFGLMIAAVSKNMSTFQAITMAVTMPMTFISGAYIPLAVLPNAVRWIGYFNPMTYAVSFFRIITMEMTDMPLDQLLALDLAFEIGPVTIGMWGAIGILGVFGIVFLVLSSIVFTRLDFSRMNRTAGTFSMWD